MSVTKNFPFVMGLNQSVDDRLLDPGRPRAIENLVIEKKGRLRMRYDYDALASTTSDGNLRLYDLHLLSGKLLGLSQFDGQDDTAPTNYIQGVHQYTGVAANAWTRLSQPALPAAARARNVGFIALQVLSVSTMDVAAGDGIVGMMWLEDISGTGSPVAQVLFFKAATGERIGQPFTVFSGGFNARIRIIFCNHKFFMAAVDTTNNAVRLTSYDPVTDTRTLLTDPLAAQANVINCMDMALSHEGTSFWIAFGLANTTSGVRGYDNTGVQTFTAAGPAVLANWVTILAEATTGTQKVNLLVGRNGTNNIDAYTYTPPATPPTLSTVNIFTPDTTTRQATMCMRAANNSHVMVIYQSGNNIQQRAFNDTTHALIAAADFQLFDSTLNSKMMNIRGQRFAGIVEVRSVTPVTVTNMLYQFTNLNVTGATDGRARPACFGEPSFGALSLGTHLPHIGFDISTFLSYWGRFYVAEFIAGGTTKALPITTEIALVETARRQSTQMGSNLYLTGGITMSIDGVSAAESGGFLVAPRLTTISASAAGGSIPTGTFQFLAVFEIYDSQRGRIQGIPSPISTIGVTGPTGSITLSVPLPHTFWDGNFLSSSRGPGAGKPVVAFYRTQNNNNGNLTFYREKSVSVQSASGGLVTTTLTADEATLGASEILYTQGARGSLSGPLPFEVTSPSTSIASSADRVLIGGLPDTASIQESRPLFPAEPIQWSQSIAFFRSGRGAVLAVARLDERRILFTATELFEVDGAGVDDNGLGNIGAPRRLPSDVGLFGGLLGWRSIVECQLGILFQGLVDQIYLLPRGGTTPQPIGIDVQDKLAAFPTITSAVYVQDDRTARFTCNNIGNTDGIMLIYDLLQQTWVTEGPYGAPTVAAVSYQSRVTRLQGTLTVLQQRASHPPAALIANAWRSGTIHPFGLGSFGRVLNYGFYGEYAGDCTLRCIATYDDETVETMVAAEVNALNALVVANASNSFTPVISFVNPLAAGSPYSFKFTPNQIKCECVRVDFEVDVPFPNPISFLNPFLTSAANSIPMTLSASRAVGDRVVVVIGLSNSAAGAPVIAGFTSRFFASTGTALQAVLEKVLDGSEISPLTISWPGVATVAFVNNWTIRNSHPTAPLEVISSATGGANSLAGAALTPSWGAKNTRWLAVLCLGHRPQASPNVIQTPDGFARGIVSANINLTPNLSGQVEGGDRAQNVATLTPSGWAWNDASEARAFTIAIRPSDTVPSAGLIYHYWTMDIEEAGKSALKSPLRMG